MFFDIFYDLCKQKNVSCKKAANDIGLSNSITTKWKKTGATPGGETLQKIANYFGVSIDFLLGQEKIEALQPLIKEDEQGSKSMNLIYIAGRDGSYQEHYLSDGQLDAIKAIIAQLPDASDDL